MAKQRNIQDLEGQCSSNMGNAAIKEMMWDMCKSLVPSKSGCYQSENTVETVISLVDTAYSISGTYIVEAIRRFSVSTSGVFTYTGVANCRLHIVGNISMVAASNNKVFSFQWYKNGSPVGAKTIRKLAAGTDIGALTINCDIEAVENDYFELKVTNETDSTNCTIKEIYLSMMGFLD